MSGDLEVSRTNAHSMYRGNQTLETILASRPVPGLVSYEVREVFIIVNLVFTGQLISVFGLVANVVNVMVFVKQGLHDTVNISLTALAVSDIGSLLAVQWFSICVTPWFVSADLPFLPLEIQSLSAGFPHVYFTRVAGYITAFVSFERCLCVVVPLKVKQIITRKLAITYNVSIFFIIFMGFLPLYLTSYYDWKFDEARNKTVIGIFYTSNRVQVMSATYIIAQFVVPLLALFIISSCTLITTFRLQSKAAWRKSASGTAMTSGGDTSSKERKVGVMIITVSLIFIICLMPLTVLLLARAIEPELDISGRYANLNWLIVSIGLLTEIINSSINIFVFYNMSTKYRTTLQRIFSYCFRKEKS